MFSKDQYCLMDFGRGRRLERFGALILDRPCPSASGVELSNLAAWKSADARFEESKTTGNKSKLDSNSLGIRGAWVALTDLGRRYFCIDEAVEASKGQDANKMSGKPWPLVFDDKFSFELKGSPFGHVGVFPEQGENWDWIIQQCCDGQKLLGRPLRVLNLFGYTGGSALAAAVAGANTTHLDAARNVVAQAKRNAALSFGENVASIRWIVDDAVKFVKREIKRGSFYDGVILDPPTYGHGAKGEVWRLSRDLASLLENIVKVLASEYSFVLLSAHTPGYGSHVLEQMLRDCVKNNPNLAHLKTAYFSKTLELKSTSNKHLYSGDLALVSARPF